MNRDGSNNAQRMSIMFNVPLGSSTAGAKPCSENKAKSCGERINSRGKYSFQSLRFEPFQAPVRFEVFKRGKGNLSPSFFAIAA
jgi:hypothetical protein